MGRKADPNSQRSRAKKMGISYSTLCLMENPEWRKKHNAMCLAYYRKHREKLKKKMLERYYKNREKRLEYQKKYAKRNKK